MASSGSCKMFGFSFISAHVLVKSSVIKIAYLPDWGVKRTFMCSCILYLCERKLVHSSDIYPNSSVVGKIVQCLQHFIYFLPLFPYQLDESAIYFCGRFCNQDASRHVWGRRQQIHRRKTQHHTKAGQEQEYRSGWTVWLTLRPHHELVLSHIVPRTAFLRTRTISLLLFHFLENYMCKEFCSCHKTFDQCNKPVY